MQTEYMENLLDYKRYNSTIYSKYFPNFSEFDLEYIDNRIQEAKDKGVFDKNIKKNLKPLKYLDHEYYKCQLNAYSKLHPLLLRWLTYPLQFFADWEWQEILFSLILSICLFFIGPLCKAFLFNNFTPLFPDTLIFVSVLYLILFVCSYMKHKILLQDLSSARKTMNYILKGGDLRQYTYEDLLDTVEVVGEHLQIDKSILNTFIKVYKGGSPVLIKKIQLFFKDTLSILESDRRFELEIDFNQLKYKIEQFMLNINSKYHDSLLMTEDMKREALENCIPDVD